MWERNGIIRKQLKCFQALKRSKTCKKPTILTLEIQLTTIYHLRGQGTSWFFFSCSGSTYRRRRLHLTVKKCIKPVQAEQYVHLCFFYLLHFASFLKALFVTVFGVFFFSRVRPGGTKLIHEKIVVEKAQRQHPIFIMELWCTMFNFWNVRSSARVHSQNTNLINHRTKLNFK